MPSKSKNAVVSIENDLAYIQKLIESDQLEDIVKSLDPDQIKTCITPKSKAIIRLLLVISNNPDLKQKIPTLREDHRKPLEAIINLGEKYRGREFLEAFIPEAVQDKSIQKKLGVTIPDDLPLSKSEAETFNTITNVKTSPLLMLNSSRLYIEMALYQQEKLLFRSTMEIDEILMVAHRFLSVAAHTCQLFNDKIASNNINLSNTICTRLG